MASDPVEPCPMKHAYISLSSDELATAIRIACIKHRMTLSEFYAKAAETYLAALAKPEAK